MLITEFPRVFKRARNVVVLLAIPLFTSPFLVSCASTGGAGYPADGFISVDVAKIYIPLRQTTLMGERYGAATVIYPGIAATNAHNANLVNGQDDMGRSPSGYDMMFFRDGTPITGGPALHDVGDPEPGEEVILYGQGANGTLRMASGLVDQLSPSTFTILANAGKGFSGGPVVNAKTGRLLGITYGFMDMDAQGGQRSMYAFRITSVLSEYASLQDHDSVKEAKGSDLEKNRP